MKPALLSRFASAVTVTLLSLAAAGPGRADLSDAELAGGSGLDARIDLELEGVAIVEVLAVFGEILGYETDVAPGLGGEVTIELHNVRAATALTAVCESAGCSWRIEDRRLRVERDPEADPEHGGRPMVPRGASASDLDEPIDIQLKDASLRETLASFATIAGTKVVIDPALEGVVTIHLRNTPVRAALDAICRMEGCRWELAETAEGPVLRFTATR